MFVSTIFAFDILTLQHVEVSRKIMYFVQWLECITVPLVITENTQDKETGVNQHDKVD